jgi:putative MFS transporter
VELTLSKRLDTLPYKPWHAKTTALVGTGVFFDSYDLNVITPTLMALAAIWGTTGYWYGALASAAFIGMFVGALGGGWLADAIGRAKTFAVLTVIYSVAMALAAASTGFGMFFFCRLVAGIGLGGLVPVALSYLAEYLPAKVRGTSMGVVNMMYALANAFGFFLGYLLIVNVPTIKWGFRVGFATGALPLILAVYAWFKFPESPRWLISKGRIKEACESVDKLETKLLGAPTVPLEKAVEIETAAAEAAKATIKPSKVSFFELFRAENLKGTLVSCIFYIGLSYATFGFGTWAPSLLAGNIVARGGINDEGLPNVIVDGIPGAVAQGLDPSLPAVQQVIIGGSIFGWMAIAAVLTAFFGPLTGLLADKIGRKRTVLLTSILLAVSVVCLGLISSAMVPLVFVTFISIGMCNAILWVYVPENFPTAVRASGVGFASAIGRITSAVSPMIIAWIGVTWPSTNADGSANAAHTLIPFASVGGLMLLAAIVIFIFGAETKDKSA